MAKPAVAVQFTRDKTTDSAKVRSTFLLMSEFERLEEWCRLVRVIFDGIAPVLVGSVITSPSYRDVDLRIVLPDKTFDKQFKGKVEKVRYLNRAISTWGQQETGLPIDFQIQRSSEVEVSYPGKRVSPMGVRIWKDIPTSGTPE